MLSLIIIMDTCLAHPISGEPKVLTKRKYTESTHRNNNIDRKPNLWLSEQEAGNNQKQAQDREGKEGNDGQEINQEVNAASAVLRPSPLSRSVSFQACKKYLLR